jgi:hypothetical protein
MIPQRNISLLSNRLAREGGRRIPEAVLERDYCLAWFLVGLSISPICKSLIFKGGTALSTQIKKIFQICTLLDCPFDRTFCVAGRLQ